MSERWDLDNGVGGAAEYGNDPWAAHRTTARPVDPFAVGSPDENSGISVDGGSAPAGPSGYPATGDRYVADAFTVGAGAAPTGGYPAATPANPANPANPGAGYSDTTAAFFGSVTGDPWAGYQAPDAASGFGPPAPAADPYVGGPYLGDSASGAGASVVAYTEASTGYHASVGYPDGAQTAMPGPDGSGGTPPGYGQNGYQTGYLEPVQTGYLEPVQQTGYLEPVPHTGYQEAVHSTGYQDTTQQTGYQQTGYQQTGYQQTGYQQAVGYPDAAGQQAPTATYQPEAGAYDYQAGYPGTGSSTGAFTATGYHPALPPDQSGYQAALPPGQHTGYQQAVPAVEHTGYQQAVPALEHTGHQQAVPALEHTGHQQAVPPIEQTGYQQAVPALDHSGYQQAVPAAEHTGYHQAVAALEPGYQTGYAPAPVAATQGLATAGYVADPYLADPYPRTGGIPRPALPALPAQPTPAEQEQSYAALAPVGFPDAGYRAPAEPTGYDTTGQATAFGLAGGATQAASRPAEGYARATGGYAAPTARYSDEPRPAGTGPRRKAETPGPVAVPPVPTPPPGEGPPRPPRRARRGGDRLTEALNFRIEPPEDLYAPADEDYVDEPRDRADRVPGAAGRRGRRAGARDQDAYLGGGADHLGSGLDALDDDALDDDVLDDDAVDEPHAAKAGRGRFSEVRSDDQSYRARRRRAAPKLVAMLLVLAVLLGGGIFAGGKVLGRFTGSKSIPDYPGPGTGSVNVQVVQGATATDIAKALFAAGVVKSEHAFITAAANNPNSVKIQPGTYRLKSQMSAAGALAVLLNSANSLYAFTFVPGKTADFLITQLSSRLGVPKQTYQDLLDHPAGKLNLPAYANGHVEGYLLPGTYDLDPKLTPAQTLNMFIDAFNAQATKINLVANAQQTGMTPDQIVTIASIIQMEVPRIEDGQKVSRVIYNRLADKTGKYQKLDMDSTTRYAINKPTGALTQSDLNNSSPYNTRLHTGLPPGAIASPALWALTSALHPYVGAQGADGQPWYYFVAMPKSKITVFASESEWPAARAQFIAEGGVG